MDSYEVAEDIFLSQDITNKDSIFCLKLKNERMMDKMIFSGIERNIKVCFFLNKKKKKLIELIDNHLNNSKSFSNLYLLSCCNFTTFSRGVSDTSSSCHQYYINNMDMNSVFLAICPMH